MFPDSPRVIYGRNPTGSVICQLRFPPILKIDAELPSLFQERIRSSFPYFEEAKSTKLSFSLPSVLEKVLSSEVADTLKLGTKSYNFVSNDKRWRIGLTRDFVALTCTNYERWEEFLAQLKQPLQAFVETYKPSFFTRIGLRYQDVISREELNLSHRPWHELLNPHIAGELAFKDFGRRAHQVWRDLLFDLDEGKGRVHLQHGFATREAKPDICYVIDADFYKEEEQMEVTLAEDYLTYFNREAGRLFRWAITPDLHKALEPRPV